MIKCPICGSEYNDNPAFCTECGVKLNYEQPRTASTGEYMHAAEAETTALSMWDFTLMEFIARIPIVNLVMFFVWGFSRESNVTRKNWARSRLIWVVIGFVLSIVGSILLFAFGSVIVDALEHLAY